MNRPVVGNRPTPRSLLLVVVSATGFGTSGPLARSLLDAGWSSGAAVLIRLAGAALVLLVPTVVVLRRTARLNPAQYRLLLGYGVVAVAGCQACYFNAIRYLSPGVALLIEYLAPALLVGWAWLRHRRRPAPATLTGLALCLTGLVLVLDVTTGGGLDPRGVAWALGAAVCVAGYFVMSARTNDSVPALVLAGSGLGIGTLVLAGLAVVGLLPVQTSTAPVTMLGASTPWWVPALGVVLLSTVLAYLAGISATRTLGATAASFFGLLEVVFAILWTWLLLGDLPAPIQLAGAAVLLTGVATVQLGGRVGSLGGLGSPLRRATRRVRPTVPA